jgi:hypothetical protein
LERVCEEDREVSVREIKDDKEDEERWLRVEEGKKHTITVPETPSKSLARAFASTIIASPPPSPSCEQSNKRVAISKLTDAQKMTLRASVAVYTQKPTTAEGVAAYMDDVQQFVRQYGTNPDFTESLCEI